MAKQGWPCPKHGGDEAPRRSLHRDCNGPGLEDQARGSKERSKERRRGRSRAASSGPACPPRRIPAPLTVVGLGVHRVDPQVLPEKCHRRVLRGPRALPLLAGCHSRTAEPRRKRRLTPPPPPPPLAPPKQDGAKFGPWEGRGPRRGWRGRGVRRGLQEGGGGCAHTGLRRGAGTRETPRLWGAEGTRSAGERTVPRSGCGEPGDRGRAAP